MKIGYFPGCSLESMAKEFAMSFEAVTQTLGVDLCEIEDWACCGSTSAHATNHLLGLALPARTLALAEEQGHERVVAPCAACYSRLATARYELGADPTLQARVRSILARAFTNRIEVLNIAHFLRDLVPQIANKVTDPQTGLKVACYYGCLLVRPPSISTFDDAENPSSLEQIAEAVGATPVTWHKRLDCCGAGFSLGRVGSVVRLGREIIADAVAAGAQAIVVGCPMCHANLDVRQQAMAQAAGSSTEIPILYVTQLVGLALGLSPHTLGMKRHFVSPEPLLLARADCRGGTKALPAAGQATRREEA